MAFVQNFPFFCIILSMFSAIISFVMNGRVAKYIHVAMVTAVLILSLATLSFVVGTGESLTGKFVPQKYSSMLICAW